MGLHRTHRKKMDRLDAATRKAENKVHKNKEKKRRHARMVNELKSGSLPYSPGVMSWLSRQVEKPARRITPADVKAVLASKP